MWGDSQPQWRVPTVAQEFVRRLLERREVPEVATRVSVAHGFLPDGLVGDGKAVAPGSLSAVLCAEVR